MAESKRKGIDFYQRETNDEHIYCSHHYNVYYCPISWHRSLCKEVYRTQEQDEEVKIKEYQYKTTVAGFVKDTLSEFFAWDNLGSEAVIEVTVKVASNVKEEAQKS